MAMRGRLAHAKISKSKWVTEGDPHNVFSFSREIFYLALVSQNMLVLTVNSKHNLSGKRQTLVAVGSCPLLNTKERADANGQLPAMQACWLK